jgi:hypothetical protein
MMNYTLQYSSGSALASAVDQFTISNFNLVWVGANVPAFVPLLHHDQRHAGNIHLGYSTLPDDGPMVGSHRILEDLEVHLLFTFRSGWSYLTSPPGGTIFGGTSTGPTEEESHLPWSYRLDMKISKKLTLGPTDMTIFLWALNILNATNIVNAYKQTGHPDDDGYFMTDSGRAYAAREGAEAVDGYHYRLGNPQNWDIPRQVRLGVRIDIH